MPKNSAVHKMYEAIKKKGASSAKAAKIAQAKTGLALATGRAPAHSEMNKHRVLGKY